MACNGSSTSPCSQEPWAPGALVPFSKHSRPARFLPVFPTQTAASAPSPIRGAPRTAAAFPRLARQTRTTRASPGRLEAFLFLSFLSTSRAACTEQQPLGKSPSGSVRRAEVHPHAQPRPHFPRTCDSRCGERLSLLLLLFSFLFFFCFPPLF